MKTNRLEVKEVKVSPEKVRELLQKYERIEDTIERVAAQKEVSNLIIAYIKMELPDLDKRVALAILDENATIETVNSLMMKLDRLHDLLVLSITGICDIDTIDMLIHYVVSLKGHVVGLENQIVNDGFYIPDYYKEMITELEKDTLFLIYKLTHETYNV